MGSNLKGRPNKKSAGSIFRGSAKQQERGLEIPQDGNRLRRRTRPRAREYIYQRTAKERAPRNASHHGRRHVAPSWLAGEYTKCRVASAS